MPAAGADDNRQAPGELTQSLIVSTPSMTGMERSVITRLNDCSVNFSRAFNPFSASTTEWPSSLSIRCMDLRTHDSSSTTRIFIGSEIKGEANEAQGYEAVGWERRMRLQKS